MALLGIDESLPENPDLLRHMMWARSGKVPAASADDLRVATFSAGLSRSAPGLLADELSAPGSVQAQRVAETVQRAAPDVVLLTDFDVDSGEAAARSFRTNYLAVGTGGQEGIDYPHVYTAEVNNGVDTGADLDNDGVIGGQGDHFSAGHDLKQAQAERANFTVEERWAYEELRYFDYSMKIWDFPKPTIAQVQGACVAGGFMIANMCDLVVASESAYFSDPVGHTLGAAATEVLIHPWVMGARKAKEMLYMGSRISAQEALAIGMVNRVVGDAQLGEAALAMAQQIAKAPPFGLRLIKRSINRSLDAQGLRTALAAHFDTHQLSHLSEGFLTARDRGLSNAIQKNPEKAA